MLSPKGFHYYIYYLVKPINLVGEVTEVEMTKSPRKSSGKMAPARKRHSNPAVEAHLTLVDADAARKSGQLSKALAMCKGLLQEYPDFVGAHQTIGLVYKAQNDLKNTINHLVKAAALNPTSLNLQLGLASSYLENGDLLAARQLASTQLQLHPESDYAMVVFGEVLIANVEFELALKHYQSFVKKSPKNYDALTSLGRVYDELGMREEAIQTLQKAVTEFKLQIETLGALSRFPKKLIEVDIEEKILTLDAAQKKYSARYMSHRGFAWANILINKGCVKEGFRELEEANLQQYKLVKKEAVRGIGELKRIHGIIEKLPVSTTRQSDASEKRVNVIIYGPSRSGKTTLERLLGTLPSVSRGFETKLINWVIRKTYIDAAFPASDRATDLPKQLDNIFGENFLLAVAEKAGEKSAFVCTQSGKIEDAYRIAITVPNIRLVFVRRNIDDVVLRIFGTKYSIGNDHTYNLETTREYVSLYYEIQDMLLARLPDVSTIINYEDMVENPIAILEDVKSFCGIGDKIGELPDIGDDRGYAKPFLELMNNKDG